MRSLLDRPLIITKGKNQSSSVTGCDLPKFDPWGEEIVQFVDHMWVVGSDNLIICLSSHPCCLGPVQLQTGDLAQGGVQQTAGGSRSAGQTSAQQRPSQLLLQIHQVAG